MAKQVGYDRLRAVFFALCKATNTSISLSCWLLYKYGEFSQLIAKSVQASDYLDAKSFEDDYLVTEFLSKYPGFNTGIDLEEAAISAFKRAERKCLVTNYRIREGLLRGFSPRVEAVIHTAARKIADVLGDVNDVDFSLSRFGPGATTSISGGGFTLSDKILEFPIRVTESALPYLKNEIETDPHWALALGIPAEGPFTLLAGCFEIEECGEVICVPKNAKTHRTIITGTTGNVFLQLCVGDHMKRRLRRVGVNLYDQTHNQKLARLGSRTGHLATVDMKAASDTIAYWLVFALLPPPWFELLDSLRNKGYVLDKEKFLFNKFSSMGNGFTFELESLIFWALAQSILDITNTEWKHASIYGDDIIIPSESFDYFIEVCEAFGFTVNPDKTHISSPFRESCGRHYYLGRDVSPIYQREVLGAKSKLTAIYRLANRITRIALRRGGFCMFDPVLASSFLAAIHECEYRHFVPIESESDDGLAVPVALLRTSDLYRVQPHGGFTLPALVYMPSRLKKSKRREDAGLAYWMRKSYSRSVSSGDDMIWREEDIIRSPVLKDDAIKQAYLKALNDNNPVMLGLSTMRSKGKWKTKKRFFTGTAWSNPVGFPLGKLP